MTYNLSYITSYFSVDLTRGWETTEILNWGSKILRKILYVIFYSIVRGLYFTLRLTILQFRLERYSFNVNFQGNFLAIFKIIFK